jgi:5,10-methenyltetrahydrofolate synthetase
MVEPHDHKLTLSAPNPTSAAARAALRRELLQRRLELPQRAERDAALAQALRDALQALRPRCIGAYCATRAEFDVLPLLGELARGGSAALALPVVEVEPRALRFVAWAPDEALRAGAYGIAEPCGDRVVEPDLLLLPCVGFAASGLRLGYGGGYYDRYLAPRDAVFTLGLAFEACRVEALRAAPHDRLLAAILTETATYGAQAARLPRRAPLP